MDWFYMDGERESGPIDSNTLKNLFIRKKIFPETKVRKENSQHWLPFFTFIKGNIPNKICTQCHQVFSNNFIIQFGDTIICEACKPIYIQQIKEGYTHPLNYVYAGFWIRFGAKIIDGVLLGIMSAMLTLPLLFQMVDFNNSTRSTVILASLFNVVKMIFPVLYSTFFVGRFGATIGKMACGLQVIVPEDDNVGYLRALGRTTSEWLSMLILFFGYIMASFDKEKRTLHDRLCYTRVVKKWN